MTLTNKQLKEIADFWQENAKHDWGTAKSLLKSKRYDACLFYCHLVIEKMLKSLIVLRTGEPIPHLHDLVELARRSGIELDDDLIGRLSVFTSFNIRCRYDDVKTAFYKRCDYKYTKKYFDDAEKIIIWLKKNYLK